MVVMLPRQPAKTKNDNKDEDAILVRGTCEDPQNNTETGQAVYGVRLCLRVLSKLGFAIAIGQ